jgi:hypothetical protein
MESAHFNITRMETEFWGYVAIKFHLLRPKSYSEPRPPNTQTRSKDPKNAPAQHPPILHGRQRVRASDLSASPERRQGIKIQDYGRGYGKRAGRGPGEELEQARGEGETEVEQGEERHGASSSG